MAEILDAIDARILELIQNDASLSVAEIADRVGLSSSPCWRRIKRLEDAGIIQKRVTILDRQKLGLSFEVYCTVKLDYSLECPLLEGQLALVKAEVSLISRFIPVLGANRCSHEHAFHDELAQQGPLTPVLRGQENHLLCQSWHHTGCLPRRGPEFPDLVAGMLVHLAGPDRQPDDGMRIDLRYVTNKAELLLVNGWIVERHLRDDDIVLFNFLTPRGRVQFDPRGII